MIGDGVTDLLRDSCALLGVCHIPNCLAHWVGSISAVPMMSVSPVSAVVASVVSLGAGLWLAQGHGR